MIAMRLLALLALAALTLPAQLRIECSWDRPLDGRLILVVAHSNSPEPRQQTSEMLDTQQVFGVDVNAARSATIDTASPGYPRESLLRVPAGDYWVQAVLNIYETFRLPNGRELKLPPDRGEGQHWYRKPGNLYSEPVRLHLDSSSTTPLRVTLAKTMPPIAAPQDTKYVRYVRIESKLLSAFWGRSVYLGAVVVVPEGFDEHPERRYPAVYYQGHYAATFTGMRGQFAQDWAAGKIPRMLIVNTQDANPYYDDSYAVNSANLGPYGDALIQELYPYVEQRFHAIAQPWARAVYGGSTGGWRALALQIIHPDFFNGAWAVSPDPIDFRAYCMVNLYQDENAFFAPSPWKRVPVPMIHTRDGVIEATMQDAIRYETVIGPRSRSGEQFDIWQAVFSPAGKDGYPAPIFDPDTGVIDHAVAEYWKQHYDLMHYLRTNWKSVGPQLTGKLHITSGNFDAFFLDRSARLAKEFLDTVEPGAVEFSATAGHGALSPGPQPPGPTFHERVIRALEERIRKTAPEGADLTSWR
jgi:enterochelin esterase-like enzyme